MVARIIGTGSYVPKEVITNAQLENELDTTDAWIRERTGIHRRHIAKEDTTVTMAIKAAKAAVVDAGIQNEELDLIIVTTIASNEVMPCTACRIQQALGAVNALCFDLNAACSGFLVAYSTVLGYIGLGIVKKALIVGAEWMSRMVDWKDRSTCILFGDGAGAAVIASEEDGKCHIRIHSDGEKGDVLQLKEQGTIAMNGQAVFRFAVGKVPSVILEVLEDAGKQVDEIDYYILHQANQRIIAAVAKRLGVSVDKFPCNIKEFGNTSSASIPILLDELKKEKVLKKGNKVILSGFGAGLTWGAIYIEL